MLSYGVHQTASTPLGQRLYYDSVISTDKRIKVDSHISGNRSDNLFIGEIAANRGDTGLTAAGGDDLGKFLRWLHADIAPHRGRQGSPNIIGELGHFSEMSNVCVGLLIAPIHHTSNRKKLGCRDLVLLCVLYDSGARAQELCDLTVMDVHFSKQPYLVLHGKGGKRALSR